MKGRPSLAERQPVSKYRVILRTVEPLRYDFDERLERIVYGKIAELTQLFQAWMEMAHLDRSKAMHRDEVFEQMGRKRRAVSRVGIEITGAHDEVGRIRRLQQQASPRPERLVRRRDKR